mmetsp:Transcript_114785/g.329664  ORF Transcript_114785/g.329664 Transcript_114785/m.329664 type:complete len:266 (+) Transcript_114785:52-849(+)
MGTRCRERYAPVDRFHWSNILGCVLFGCGARCSCFASSSLSAPSRDSPSPVRSFIPLFSGPSMLEGRPAPSISSIFLIMFVRAASQCFLVVSVIFSFNTLAPSNSALRTAIPELATTTPKGVGRGIIMRPTVTMVPPKTATPPFRSIRMGSKGSLLLSLTASSCSSRRSSCKSSLLFSSSEISRGEEGGRSDSSWGGGLQSMSLGTESTTSMDSGMMEFSASDACTRFHSLERTEHSSAASDSWVWLMLEGVSGTSRLSTLPISV